MAYTAIDKPTDYFDSVLYTGNGAANRDISGLDFQPDWVWIKARSDTTWHHLFDSTRGANKPLNSNVTNAEGSVSTFPAFNSDGFRVNAGNLNTDTQTNVAWCWKANGGTTSTNSDGTVNTTMQLNSTAGFSIITWTGNGSSTGTVGHGLGAIPDCIIVKRRESTSNWSVAFPKFETSKLLALNLTSAFFTASGLSSYNSSTFVDGSGSSSEDTVAYCFKNIQGYSKIGGYTGNGNADGPFIYTGFKPAMVILRNSSAGDNWIIKDNKRDIDNPIVQTLFPNQSTAEDTNSATYIDLLSNGIKIRGTDSATNTDGASFVYMAWAESPFVSSEGVPTTAR
jgi:hypothetical protein